MANTYNPNLKLNLFLILAFVFTFAGCNTTKDDELEVPATFEFTREGVSTVDYSGQTQRLDMLQLIGTYLKTANIVASPSLDVNVLKNMFANTNSPFDGQSFSKNLKSKCFAADTAMFIQYLEEAATISLEQGTASSGVSGVLVDGSSDPTVGYRVNEDGLELTQIILKGLMGSVFYYQAMEAYLTEERMGLNGNDELVEGENHTDMEHYFDEAFGYFGIPNDYPNAISLDNARFWGEYCNKRNEGLYPNMNEEIALAFRKARAAIVAKDYEERDVAIQTIQQKWAVVIAASAVDYLSQALSTAGSPEYKRHHVMSEAIGFMLALKYHFNGGNSKYPPHFSYTHIDHSLMRVGLTTNLYDVTDTQIEEAIEHIKLAFPSGEIK